MMDPKNAADKLCMHLTQLLLTYNYQSVGCSVALCAIRWSYYWGSKIVVYELGVPSEVALQRIGVKSTSSGLEVGRLLSKTLYYNYI